MPKALLLGWCVAFFSVAIVSASTMPGRAQEGGIVQVKLGISSMSKAEQTNLWKMVDEYATVDALQQFCGKKLNLQRRAWRAVATCVEVPSLRRVLREFRSKKSKYLKAWEELHGEDEKKKLVCDRFKGKLNEYARIIKGQIEEAASMCRNCFFC
jgi:hypothetical protein